MSERSSPHAALSTPATLERPRVVVTGMGAVSCLGNGCASLLDALHSGRSGMRFVEAFAQLGMSSQVGGPVDHAALTEPPRKIRRYLSTPALYAWQAMNEAMEQAGLSPDRLRAADCGLVVGGGSALSEHQDGLDQLRVKGIGKLSPFLVPRGMGSNLSASLAHAYGIGGRSYTMSSACTSAAHAIGHAMELIQLGKQNIVFCGGSEELHATSALGFDVMGALSSASNDDPPHASRPYDARRDGFVLAAGAGMLVLESLEHAQARGATVLAELCGYGTSTEAANMVGPGVYGIASAMREALDAAGCTPDYINTQACSTPQGDAIEWQAMHTVFAERDVSMPPFSSIKSQTGHAPSAAAALDAIASVLMMQHGFIAAGRPIDMLDPMFVDTSLVTSTRAQSFDCVLSNSFGFGGSCVSLVFRRMADTRP